MEHFELGMAETARRFKAGETLESITHSASLEAYGRGMVAAVEALLGWHDIAEREARAHGYSRDRAARLVGAFVEANA